MGQTCAICAAGAPGRGVWRAQWPAYELLSGMRSTARLQCAAMQRCWCVSRIVMLQSPLHVTTGQQQGLRSVMLMRLLRS